MTLPVISRVRKALRPIGSVDGITADRIVGWAAGQGSVTVEAWVDDECVVKCVPSQVRNDVATAHPRRRNALTSGFSLNLPSNSIAPDAISQLRVIARGKAPWSAATTLAEFDLAGETLQQSLREVAPTEKISPFPRNVTDLIAAKWPEDCADLTTAAGQRRFVKRLKQLFATPGINALPTLVSYSRYLSATLAHCRFVERHFPATNAAAGEGASDFHCKPNSVRELFPIIHQLYVLKSHGIEGDFAEFGCFKGYSSSMLSFACQQLGVTMHIFDSFEGLPPAEGSGYEAGQYTGSLDEVRSNVERFGSVEAVQFHKGFFADTFREWRPPALMCLWMDVDLEVSARDLMIVADRLDPRSTLFSHECSPGVFRSDQIVSPAAPDNPIAPMLARFEELRRPLTGHYVAGFTGAFWPRDDGIPVISTDVLFDLIASAV